MIRMWCLGVPSGQDVRHVCRRPEQNPKKNLVRRLCSAPSFSLLHHLTLMSYPSPGFASALGPPSMKVPVLLLERSRFSWVPAKTQRQVDLWGTGTCWKLEQHVERIKQLNLSAKAQFVLLCYRCGCLVTRPRTHLVKPTPLKSDSYQPYSDCLTPDRALHSSTFSSQRLCRLIWSRTGRVRMHPEVSWEYFTFLATRITLLLYIWSCFWNIWTNVLLTKDWNDVIDVQPGFYEGVDRDEQA